MIVTRWLAVGFLLLAVAVACGAFGAHALASRLDARGLELWETATRYLFLGALALGLAGLAGQLASAGAAYSWGAGTLLFGTLVFFGTVAALALGAPRWLGAVTPLGGLGMIVGLALLAWAAWRITAGS